MKIPLACMVLIIRRPGHLCSTLEVAKERDGFSSEDNRRREAGNMLVVLGVHVGLNNVFALQVLVST